MADNPTLTATAFDRVSIRSVLARDGEDVTQALMQAGIFDPVVVPVVLGETADPVGGILGDGVTPNLTGVLEPDESDHDPLAAETVAEPTRSHPVQQSAKRGSARLPAAYGMQPLAPVRKR